MYDPLELTYCVTISVLNDNLYISHTIASFFVPASDSVHTCSKQYKASGDDQKPYLYYCLFDETGNQHPENSRLKPICIPQPRGKPSSLVTSSNVRSCTVPFINIHQ